jgi:hypothetical protein
VGFSLPADRRVDGRVYWRVFARLQRCSWLLPRAERAESAAEVMRRFIIAAALLMAGPASAEPVYQGFSYGTYYDIHIESKQSLGNDRWRFRTRAEYSGGQPDFISEWSEADCNLGTVDGEVVPEIAQYGYQRGLPEVFKAICGER